MPVSYAPPEEQALPAGAGKIIHIDIYSLTQVVEISTLSDVAKTRKVQVTLEEDQYEKLAEIAERDGKKLAAVVRESVVQYCLGPESKKAKRKALEALLAEAAPPPVDYATWEREYTKLKSEAEDSRPGRRKGG